MRHRRRLSGPLLDRIDVLAHLAHGGKRDLGEPPLTTSKQAGEMVHRARERQARRLKADGVTVNAHMDAPLLRKHVVLDSRGEELLRGGAERGILSARGQHRVLRVARTIADLHGSERVRARDIGTAIALRPETALADNRAA